MQCLALFGAGVTSDTIQFQAGLSHLLAALSELRQPELEYSAEVQAQSDGTAVSRETREAMGPVHEVFRLVVGERCMQQGPIHVAARLCSPCLQALRVMWKQPGTGLRMFFRLTLTEAVPAGPVVAGMLQLLLGNLSALRDTCRDLLDQNRAFEQQASRNQDVIDKYVKNKEDHDKVIEGMKAVCTFRGLRKAASRSG
jgi:hypothetical protein